MAKPSIFSRDYERLMRKRRKRINCLIGIILFAIIVGLVIFFKFNTGYIKSLMEKFVDKQILSININNIDDIIGENIDYAFNKDIGYLTSCPVNAGTGLKVSVIVHLPILSLQDNIDSYYNIAQKIGANIKGIDSEKSNTLGNMYELYNQCTFGMSEKNIIESIKSLAKDMILKEDEARNKLKEESSIELEDKIFRSLGILEKSRIISAYEAMKHLSNIKLGIEMKYIDDINIEKIDSLMKGLKPGLRLTMTSRDSDIERANYLREEFTLANRKKI